jgi:histidine triad (HIT) family protein
VAPQAPVHLLVIPKTGEYKDVTDLAAHDPGLLAELVHVAKAAAVQAGSPDFRLIFNTGAGAGQTVFHVHAHVLGGAEQHEQSLGGNLEEGSLGRG